MSDLFIDGPVAAREFVLEHKCQEGVGHTHNYDHITFIQAGAVRVYTRLPGEETWQVLGRFKCGEFFTTAKHLEHKLKAEEPGTRYACVFVHRDFGSAEVVSEYNGNSEAYV